MAKPYVLLSFCCSLLLGLSAAAQTDTLVGCSVGSSDTRSIDRLAHALCDGLNGEREKANAIYNWVTHNIRYDVKVAMDGRLTHDDDAKRVLRRRKAVCEGYAQLYMELCHAAGLQAVTVEGYARDWIFDNGDKLYVPRHEWNAVLINGEWQLTDVAWGAGGLAQSPGWLRRQLNRLSKNPVQTGKLRFVARYDTSYFLQDPQRFRLAHLPADPIWQLTDTAMPVAVFEAGAAAINEFNRLSRPAQQKDLLGAAADYNEVIRTYEYADRAFAYNPRYYGPLAMREMLDAEVQIQFGDSINKYDPMPARFRYGKATRSLGMCREYLKKQQEGYSLEARELKQKNSRKSDSAKKYVREIRTDNKRLIAQCQQKKRSSRSKETRIAEKDNALHRLATDKAMAAKGQKPVKMPRSEAIADALRLASEGDAQRSAGKAAIQAADARVRDDLSRSRTRLDSLAAILMLSDSLMIGETIARIQMHDVYDDEVIRYSGPFREIKYRTADSLQARYQQDYDSLLRHLEERSRLEYAQLSTYKQSLRSLARYQQPGVSQEAQREYARLHSSFDSGVAAYASHVGEYRQATKEHAAVFTALERLYRREGKLADYMERAEKKRKEQEEHLLAKKAAFNKKESLAQQAAVEKSMKRAKRLAEPAAM